MVTIPAPMQAPETLHKPFTDSAWLYEIKFDGYRCLAGVEKDDGFKADTDEERNQHIASRVDLRTKSGANCGHWFSEIVEGLAHLPGGPYVLDGEVCVLRSDGISDFNLLQ